MLRLTSKKSADKRVSRIVTKQPIDQASIINATDGHFVSRPLTGQSGVRPDAYADCTKIMRVVARASIEIAGIKATRWCERPGCFWTVVLALTTWVMAFGLAVFLFG